MSKKEEEKKDDDDGHIKVNYVKSKSFGTPIKKGQVLNPNGRPKTSEEAKMFKKLTLDSYCKLVDKFINASPAEIKKIVTDPDATVLEIYIAQIVQKGIAGGDTARLAFLLDRLIGPVKQKIEHSGTTPTTIIFKERKVDGK